MDWYCGGSNVTLVDFFLNSTSAVWIDIFVKVKLDFETV